MICGCLLYDTIAMGLPLCGRRAVSFIRTISITSLVVSFNEVFEFLIPEVVKGVVGGFECFDGPSTEVRVFLDMGRYLVH